MIASTYQTRGRGRFKRKWISPRGKGLLCSIILRPNLKTSSASILTHVAAASIVELLRTRFKLPAKIKKPNDVLVAERKIAGILTESSSYGKRLEYVVIGIGLNVNAKRGELVREATSIYSEAKEKVENEALLDELLSIFSVKYEGLNGDLR